MPDYNEFYDHRLVAIYDTVCPIDDYRDFYLDIAAELSAKTILDLGCGSGLLTCALAERGHEMIGVEPSGLMLDLARRRDTAKQVQWIEGDARHLGESRADLVIMTGHVAQFFIDDESWAAALKAIHKALKPGGHVAFESRNPVVQPWADGRIESHIDWPSQVFPREVEDPVAGKVTWWVEVVEVNVARVTTTIHYVFQDSGAELTSTNELRYRSLAELKQSLAAAGFSIRSVFGGWDRHLMAADSPEFIFVAERA